MNTNYNGPMRFSHRGNVQVAPENTQGAYQAAVDEGYEALEVDIRLSADGEIIMCHDSNFTTMTIGMGPLSHNGMIEEMNWQDIVKVQVPYALHLLPRELPKDSGSEHNYDVLSIMAGMHHPYARARVEDPRTAHLMTFPEFDRWMSSLPQKPTVEIEVKVGGMMPRLKEIFATSDNVDHYIVFSGVQKYIDEIQEAFGGDKKPAGLRLGANIWFLTDETKAYIESHDFWEVGLNAFAYTEKEVQWLAERGIKTLSNLGDCPEWWEKMVAYGTLGFKTNYPQAYTKWWMEKYGK